MSTVEAVASGSTPPAWATLTTRSTSRIVSENTTRGMASIGSAMWLPGLVKKMPLIVGSSTSAGVRKPLRKLSRAT